MGSAFHQAQPSYLANLTPHTHTQCRKTVHSSLLLALQWFGAGGRAPVQGQESQVGHGSQGSKGPCHLLRSPVCGL